MISKAASGISYSEPAPHNFSFNSPQGACVKCKGLGKLVQIDLNKIIPDMKKSISEGAIEPIGKPKNTLLFAQLQAIATKYDFTFETPMEEISDEAMSTILYGANERLVK